MKVPPFKLDAWLMAHEFATPPIRYNIASSTGPLWTFAELMALGGDGGERGSARRPHVVLRTTPGQQTTARARRCAARRRSGHVLMMTGASEAIMALTCLFAEPGASILVPKPVYPAVPVLARAWGLGVREYDARSRARLCADRGWRAGGRGCQHARGIRQHASQPDGFGDAAGRAAQARRCAGRARHSAHRRRGVSPAVFRRARTQRQRAAQHHRAR